jgi:hypothetical protein
VREISIEIFVLVLLSGREAAALGRAEVVPEFWKLGGRGTSGSVLQDGRRRRAVDSEHDLHWRELGHFVRGQVDDPLNEEESATPIRVEILLGREVAKVATNLLVASLRETIRLRVTRHSEGVGCPK